MTMASPVVEAAAAGLSNTGEGASLSIVLQQRQELAIGGRLGPVRDKFSQDKFSRRRRRIRRERGHRRERRWFPKLELLLRFAALSPPPPSMQKTSRLFFAIVRPLAALAVRISSRLSASRVDLRALVASERRKEWPGGTKETRLISFHSRFFFPDDRRFSGRRRFFLLTLSLFLASKPPPHLHLPHRPRRQDQAHPDPPRCHRRRIGGSLEQQRRRR